jgi:hypothetical protein
VVSSGFLEGHVVRDHFQDARPLSNLGNLLFGEKPTNQMVYLRRKGPSPLKGMDQLTLNEASVPALMRNLRAVERVKRLEGGDATGNNSGII